MGQEKYPDELRERATRMALDALADPARVKGVIRRIGEELGVRPEVLRFWGKRARVDGGLRPGTTTEEVQRIKEPALGVRELRGANAFLKSASACLSRWSVSARPVDLPVHRDQEGGVWGLADLCRAQRGWCTDRPEHVTHARRSRPPSARSMRDEALRGEMARVHEDSYSVLGPQDARDAGPTRDRRASRCRSRGPLHRPCGSWATWAYTVSDAPSRRAPRAARRESSARPTWSGATSRRLLRVGCGSPTFPRKREVPPPMYAPSPGGSMWLS